MDFKTMSDLNPLMNKDANCNFDPGSDSLEAIRDAVDVITPKLVVPTANSTDNLSVRDVLGNKTDNPVDNVGTTASLMAYLKAIVQELDQRKVPKMACRGWTNPYGWDDVVNINDKGFLTGIISVVRLGFCVPARH